MTLVVDEGETVVFVLVENVVGTGGSCYGMYVCSSTLLGGAIFFPAGVVGWCRRFEAGVSTFVCLCFSPRAYGFLSPWFGLWVSVLSRHEVVHALACNWTPHSCQLAPGGDSSQQNSCCGFSSFAGWRGDSLLPLSRPFPLEVSYC